MSPSLRSPPNRNAAKLAEQARKVGAEFAVVADPAE